MLKEMDPNRNKNLAIYLKSILGHFKFGNINPGRKYLCVCVSIFHPSKRLIRWLFLAAQDICNPYVGAI